MRLFDGSQLPRARFASLLSFDPFFWKRVIPTDLEIGAGTGTFALDYARSTPARRLIAVEHTRERFEKFFRAYESSQNLPATLYPVHANAISYVFYEVPDESLENIFLLYPNPEANNPNARWFRMPFFSVLLAKLKVGGQIHLVTNLRDYATEADKFAEKVWRIRRVRSREIHGPTVGNFSPRTLFEKKYLERNETCYDQTWLKEKNRD